jgi:hypothetical protein
MVLRRRLLPKVWDSESMELKEKVEALAEQLRPKLVDILAQPGNEA